MNKVKSEGQAIKQSKNIDPGTALFELQIAHSVQDVARALRLESDKFFYSVANTDTDRFYRSFVIPKKRGGERIISVPLKGVALAQDRLAVVLDHVYKPGGYVKGFVRGESFASNARYHEKQMWILNLDVEDFFPSVTFPRVRGLFLSNLFGFNDRVSTILARICTHGGSIPQGASTSPLIANIVAKNLDRKLIAIAHREKLRYSRYSDDISLSSSKKSIPTSVVHSATEHSEGKHIELGHEVIAAFREAGFRINSRKTRLMRRNERQEVTGLIVNTKTNIWRRDISMVRMKLHSAHAHGLESAAKLWLNGSAQQFVNHIAGWLSFIRQIRGEADPVLAKLCEQAVLAGITDVEWIKRLADMHKEFDVFLSHASEDKDRARILKDRLEDSGVRVFFDETSIRWGDSLVERINFGLTKSMFFMPLLTSTFEQKGWTNKELNSAIQSNISRKKRILPIKDHGFELEGSYALLNDTLYKEWPGDAEKVETFLGEVTDSVLALLAAEGHNQET